MESKTYKQCEIGLDCDLDLDNGKKNTLKTCTECMENTRMPNRKICRKCRSRRAMIWAKQNKDKCLESARKYRKSNRKCFKCGCVIEKHRKFYCSICSKLVDIEKSGKRSKVRTIKKRTHISAIRKKKYATPIKNGSLCSRRGCVNHADYKVSSNTAYCWKHFRFKHMRQTARRRGLYVPSFIELEHMLIFNNGMDCRCCGKNMVWHHSLRSLCDVITLQHDSDAGVSFLCFSCNAAHGQVGDAYIYRMQKNLITKRNHESV